MDAAEAGTAVKLEALIVDWGGVLTPPLDRAMTSWAEADGVDFEHFADVMRAWVGARGPGPVASGGAGEPAGGAVGPGEPAGGAVRAGEAEGGAVRAGEPADGAVGAGGAGGADGADGADGAGEAGDGLGGAAGVSDEELEELGEAAEAGVVPASPVHALERGEISVQEFERRLAAALAERGSPVPAEGLLGRVLGGLEELRDDMLGLVRRARRSGLRTALLSNSWGDGSYPEHAWEGAFDVVVISGRVGMRKPDADIFRHTADLLGLPPQACVMVDDLAHNIHGAVATGMVGVLHESYERTAEELEILFDRPLRA